MAISAGGTVTGFSSTCGRRLMQNLPNGGDIVFAVGVGKQAVVSDPMKAGGRHVQQEAAHELLVLQGHRFVTRPAVLTAVFPSERDAAVVHCLEARVGDRDAVWVARQVRQHRLGSGEGALGVGRPTRTDAAA